MSQDQQNQAQQPGLHNLTPDSFVDGLDDLTAEQINGSFYELFQIALGIEEREQQAEQQQQTGK